MRRFPAHDYKEQFRLVVATPSAATREPSRHWVAEADDEHLQNIVNLVVEKYGADNIRSFWLLGHSQGGMTSNRLLNTPFFAERVDGWLSLSGGRMGPAPRADPNARDGRVIADIVRLDKGHTEGLEPGITEQILKLMVQEPGGKSR